MTTATSRAEAPRAPTRFVDPETLARIRGLDLLAKRVVEGFIAGLHRSPFLGRTMDFAEYRSYLPGDDIRQVDWKLYSRTDRFYVKQFEGDTNTNLLLLVDCSRSMDFGSGALTKLDYARYLAASLAYFSSRQKDRVGLVTMDAGVRDFVPPAARHLRQVLLTLDRLTPGGAGDLPAALQRVAGSARRRGITVLASDLYCPPADLVDSLRGLHARGHDLIVFHLLDRAEVELPFEDPADFVDLETGAALPIVSAALRERYLALVRAHIDTLSARLAELGIDYEQITSQEPLDRALFRYLSRRQRASR